MMDKDCVNPPSLLHSYGNKYDSNQDVFLPKKKKKSEDSYLEFIVKKGQCPTLMRWMWEGVPK